jgi:hypothetical protein
MRTEIGEAVCIKKLVMRNGIVAAKLLSIYMFEKYYDKIDPFTHVVWTEMMTGKGHFMSKGCFDEHFKVVKLGRKNSGYMHKTDN